MMVNWQQVVSLIIVGVSAALLIGSQVLKRRRAKNAPCGADCGCSALKAIEDARKN
jgi:hypothetical protein